MPIPFSWDPDGCDDLIPVGSAHVQVIVTNPPPVGAVRVRGCGQLRRLPPTQSAIELEIPAIPCALEAWRYDGALRALSPLATVDLSPDEHQTVELTLPEEEVAGLGVRFLPGDAFVEVLAVVPDSPAWDAGLRDGDRILSVDDEPVGGLEASDFIAIGTGPVGTEALLVLESEDGGRETVALERAPVSTPVN
jgi:membrane-associated protease RseP (regulator of RpoE activity)